MLSTADAWRAIDSGASYLVTPTMDLDVVRLALQRQIAIFPGGFSPTELAAGWAAGATAVKIFPAQTVGAGYLLGQETGDAATRTNVGNRNVRGAMTAARAGDNEIVWPLPLPPPLPPPPLSLP